MLRFVPFKEKRIFRSRQEIKEKVRNCFVVFVKVPNEVGSGKNKCFAIDVPYWSIQNMTNLSEVCVSSYVEFSYSLHEGRFSGYKSFWYIVPDDFKKLYDTIRKAVKKRG